MQDTPQLSAAKRALLEQYLNGRNTTQVAQALRQQSDKEIVRPISPLLAFHTSGSRRPFFFLHGDYRDHPLWCLTMAEDLGPDQPFYALEPEKLESLVAPSFEEHAAAHLKWVRTVQPEGPYLIGGWCGGALLSYEMARQLRAEGQAVDLLVLMEPPLIPKSTRLLRSLIGWLGPYMRFGADIQLDWFLGLRQRYFHAREGLRYLYRSLRRAQHIHPQGIARSATAGLRKGLSWLHRSARLFGAKGERYEVRIKRPRDDYLEIYTWMAANYRIYPHVGTAALLWSRGEFDRRVKVVREWCRVAQGAEVRVIRGTLTTCRTDHVHELAAHLHACLSQVNLAMARPSS